MKIKIYVCFILVWKIHYLNYCRDLHIIVRVKKLILQKRKSYIIKISIILKNQCNYFSI